MMSHLPAWTRSADLRRFILVGTLGFCIDGGILQLLSAGAGWTPLAARSIAFPVAVTVTWWVNRVWSFQSGRARSAGRQYAAYLLVQSLGLAINFTAFVLLIETSAWLQSWPIVALAIGSVLAMTATYLLSRRFVFRA